MYVRLKEISSRRYVYLVEGKRSKDKVSQKTLSYLGPLDELALGVSRKVRKKAESKSKRNIDWDSITAKLNDIPLTLVELEKIRQKRYFLAVRARNFESRSRKRRPVQGTTPKKILEQRAEGELAALTKLSTIGFKRTFKKVADRTYRMRF